MANLCGNEFSQTARLSKRLHQTDIKRYNLLNKIFKQGFGADLRIKD